MFIVGKTQLRIGHCLPVRAPPTMVAGTLRLSARYRAEVEIVMTDKNNLPDSDRVEGSAKNMGGKVKEGLGNLTGDSKLKAEGKGDQAEGKIQNAVGGI